MIDQISEALDACRSGFPVVLIAMVPVIMIVVSPIKVADAAQDFSVFRMQQYDLQGISYGMYLLMYDRPVGLFIINFLGCFRGFKHLKY